MTGQVDTAELLLHNGADVKANEDEGRTSLTGAADYGQRDTDNNTKDDIAWTSMTYEALNGKRDIAEMLLQHSADVNAKDIEGRTSLTVEAGNGQRG